MCEVDNCCDMLSGECRWCLRKIMLIGLDESAASSRLSIVGGMILLVFAIGMAGLCADEANKILSTNGGLVRCVDLGLCNFQKSTIE